MTPAPYKTGQSRHKGKYVNMTYPDLNKERENYDLIGEDIIYCGVDVGKRGALVFLEDMGKTIAHIVQIPLNTIRNEYDIYDLSAKIRKISNDYYDSRKKILSIVEHASYRKSDGKPQLCSFIGGYGVLKGILASCNIPQVYVGPKEWKEELDLIKKGKVGSVELAHKIWNKETFPKKIQMHDGVMEAALISYYGIKIFTQELALPVEKRKISNSIVFPQGSYTGWKNYVYKY